MAFFNFPFHIAKDKPAVANEVQSNLDSLLAWILDNVIQKDGSVAMTGPLVLAPGDPSGGGGSQSGSVSKAYVDAMLPVGAIFPYGGTVLPVNWLWCDGATYTVTQHAQLSGAIQRAFTATNVPQNSFQVPNFKQRVPAGVDAADAVFALGKFNALTQRNTELLNHQHNVPAHGHALTGATGNDREQHQHSFTPGDGGAGPGSTRPARAHHTHVSNGGHSEVMFRDSGYFTGYSGPHNTFNGDSVALTWGPLNQAGADHWHGFSGTVGNITVNHTHAIGTLAVGDKPAFLTDFQGAGTTLTDKNLPPYLVTNFIIYRGGAN